MEEGFLTNFREWVAPLSSTHKFAKMRVFEKIELKPKSWILILKGFEFLDIFIESK